MAIEYQSLFINILGAFLIIILGLILGQIISNIIRRFIRGIGASKILEQQLKVKVKLDTYISTILKYTIYLIAIILALNQLGLSTKVLKILFIIILIFIIIFTILAFKDWLPNLLAGIYLIRTKKIKKGEIIKISEIEGRILEVNLLETKIETNNKEILFIPNSTITRKVVKIIKK
ncbi:MAG TPA: mechanosensitive ion channel domain-containing protein [Candidatus Nanoarchaeia archaeon]|nr:mechanosensitive ion channel domain-containing protein [Candidatus Nanoarchaeia archaeon]